MYIAISLAQFVMLALAVMGSNILVNSGATAVSGGWSAELTQFVAAYGLWLLLIPALWLLFALWCEKAQSRLARVAPGIGVGITVGVLVLIVLVLSF